MASSTPFSPHPAGLDLTGRHDEQLAVERVRAGDTLALEVIFTAYRAELFAEAIRITRSQALAEEAVQDVFLAIWTGRANWHVNTSLGAYLHRAVHNVAARTATSRTRGAGAGEDMEVAQRGAPARFRDPAPQPDERAAQAELDDAVRAAKREMPPRPREIYTLSRDSDLSNREIAERLGLSVKTVEGHMKRALDVLRRRLSKWRP